MTERHRPPHRSRPDPPTSWDRPTGDVDDPWAWLRDRDDPDTIAYLEAENAYTAAWFDEPRRAALATTIYERDQVPRPGDRPVGAGPSRRRGGTSRARSRARRTRCTAAATTLRCPTSRRRDPRLQRRGRRARLLRRPRRRSVARPHAARLVERRRRRRALHAAGPRPGHRRRSPRRADRNVVVGRRRLVGRRAVAVLRPARRADASARDLAPPPRHAVRPTTCSCSPSPTSASSSDVGSTRSERWIVIAGVEARRRRCGSSRPTTRRPRRASSAARADDVEYDVDHWGDRFVVLTNLDAPDFRVMTAPLDAPGEWTELLVAHEPGRRITAVEPFAGHLVPCTSGSDAQPTRPRARSRRRDAGARPRRRAARRRARRQPGVGDRRRCGSPTSRSPRRRRCTTSTWRPASARCASRRRRRTSTSTGTRRARTWADGGRRHGRCRSTSCATSTRRSTARRRRWSTATAPTSRRCRRGSASARLSLLDRGVVWALVHPRGGGELGRAWYLDGKLLHKRNTFTDTIAVRRAPRRRAASPTDRGSPIRGGSAGGLLVGACVTMRPERFAAAVAEVPFVDVVTTMSDPTLPLTVTEWEEWGDPRARAVRQLHAGYSPYDNTAAPTSGAMAGDVRHRRAQRPRVELPRAGEVGGQAARRSAPAPSAPLLLRTEMGAGHARPERSLRRLARRGPHPHLPARHPLTRRFPQAFSSVPAPISRP